MLEIIKMEADWCRTCTVLDRALDPVMNEYVNIVDFSKVELTDENMAEIMDRWALTSLPTVLFIKDGDDVFRFTGLKNKAEIRQIVELYR